MALLPFFEFYVIQLSSPKVGVVQSQMVPPAHTLELSLITVDYNLDSALNEMCQEAETFQLLGSAFSFLS